MNLLHEALGLFFFLQTIIECRKVVDELIWLLLIVLIILFLLIAIFFTKITINLNYYHKNDDDQLKIEFRIWHGLIKYKKCIPLIKIDDDSPSIIVKGTDEKNTGEPNPDENTDKITHHEILNSLNNFHEILEHVFYLKIIIVKFLKKVTVKHFEWDSVIGAGDASHTGTITGVLWTIKGLVIRLMSSYLTMKERPKLMIHPNFQRAIIQTELSCMFEFRIGHAILAGIKLIKFWKGGRPHLKLNTIFSNQKSKSV